MKEVIEACLAMIAMLAWCLVAVLLTYVLERG